mmetsp:Transcript_25723/g.61948  ORF Transcript_25723/g.61948 Transcript_25723/m.61948 type:complete len:239 (+) Transcript_25723:378-1094(+)
MPGCDVRILAARQPPDHWQGIRGTGPHASLCYVRVSSVCYLWGQSLEALRCHPNSHHVGGFLSWRWGVVSQILLGNVSRASTATHIDVAIAPRIHFQVAAKPILRAKQCPRFFANCLSSLRVGFGLKDERGTVDPLHWGAYPQPFLDFCRPWTHGDHNLIRLDDPLILRLDPLDDQVSVLILNRHQARYSIADEFRVASTGLGHQRLRDLQRGHLGGIRVHESDVGRLGTLAAEPRGL